MNIKKLLQQGTGQLRHTSDSARLDAEVILANVTGHTRTWLFAHDTDTVTPAVADEYQRLITQRATGIPVAYLTGECEFWSLPLTVTRSVLTPRGDTERLVEAVLNYLQPFEGAKILDAGTGSGAISVALAVERPDLQITAVDVSPDALTVASLNLDRHHCNNVTTQQSDWFERLDNATFQLIVSNPPYIAATDDHLDGDGVRHEPRLALTSGADGLDAIRQIIHESQDHLVIGGALYLEHGHNQADSVAMLLTQSGFREIEHYTDLAGKTRVTRGIHPRSPS